MSLTHLFWIDLETTGLPKVNDYSDVHILEVGAILTDMNFNILEGYTEVIGMTDAAAQAIKRTPFVWEMHKKNGLLKDCVESTFTVRDAEASLLELLDEHDVKAGSVAIAGSGVAAFDFPAIKEHMPELASRLAYFSYDIGCFRRLILGMSPHPLINPATASYGDDKLHRAMADVKAHLGEAKAYQEAISTRLPPF